MERATLIEMIETGGCAGLDVAIMEALGLEYNGEVLDSLDAAVALVERVVGARHTWSITSPQYNRDSQYRASDWTAHIWCPQKLHGWHAESRYSGPAALITALLKASEP